MDNRVLEGLALKDVMGIEDIPITVTNEIYFVSFPLSTNDEREKFKHHPTVFWLDHD